MTTGAGGIGPRCAGSTAEQQQLSNCLNFSLCFRIAQTITKEEDEVWGGQCRTLDTLICAADGNSTDMPLFVVLNYALLWVARAHQCVRHAACPCPHSMSLLVAQPSPKREANVDDGTNTSKRPPHLMS